MSYFTRHSGLLDSAARQRRINVIGAGAVGSYTVLGLAKMGFTNIHVWDDDTVDEENVGVQLYGPDNVGQAKTDALYCLVRNQTDIEIEAYEGRVPLSCPLPGLTIVAVDNMETRAAVWERLQGYKHSQWYLDPRMGAEQAALYVMQPHHEQDRNTYAKTLYSDREAVEEPCTAKATSYTAMLLAGSIIKAVKDILSGHEYTRIITWNIAENEQDCQLATRRE